MSAYLSQPFGRLQIAVIQRYPGVLLQYSSKVYFGGIWRKGRGGKGWSELQPHPIARTMCDNGLVGKRHGLGDCAKAKLKPRSYIIRL